jgi:predicted Fe-Mo cluster-binding NifX family protein
MRIVVTSNGAGGSADPAEILGAPASPAFGRCPTYVFVDIDAADEDRPMEVEAVENPAIAASGGAGIQAAQFVIERGAQAVVTGNVGPNAFNVFQSAGVSIHLFGGGSVREAVEAYRAGELQSVAEANVQAGVGMGRGRGMGRRAAVPPTPLAPAAAPAGPQEEEIAALRDMASGLRRQLAEVMERLDRLEKKEE